MNSNDTPTPRTDAAEYHSAYGPSNLVPIGFARELERENVRLREALEWVSNNFKGESYADYLEFDAMMKRLNLAETKQRAG